MYNIYIEAHHVITTCKKIWQQSFTTNYFNKNKNDALLKPKTDTLPHTYHMIALYVGLLSKQKTTN